MINLEKAREAKRQKTLARQQNYYNQKNRLYKKYGFEPLLSLPVGHYTAELMEAVETVNKKTITLLVFKINDKHYFATRESRASKVTNLAVNLLNLELLTDDDVEESIATLLTKYCIGHSYTVNVFPHTRKSGITAIIEYKGDNLGITNEELVDNIKDKENDSNTDIEQQRLDRCLDDDLDMFEKLFLEES